jgi:hypothetical protein
MRSKQTSIRFDPEKLELIKKREKIGTEQRVVDFLMDAYYWRYKLISLPQNDALGQKLAYVTPAKPKTPFEQYSEELVSPDSLDGISRTMANAEKDRGLTFGEKEKLKKMAHEKAKDFQY